MKPPNPNDTYWEYELPNGKLSDGEFASLIDAYIAADEEYTDQCIEEGVKQDQYDWFTFVEIDYETREILQKIEEKIWYTYEPPLF